MEWLAKKLTSCLVQQKVIDEKEQELYQFGFQSGFEMVSCYLISLAAAAYLHRIPEYLLFSVVFIPVRSYAGGLHLEKFSQCFVCSCLSIIAVIMLSDRLVLSPVVSTAAIIIMLLILFILRPVDHVNRPVDEDEQYYFTHKLRFAIFGIGVLAFILFILGRTHYLVLVMLTLASAIISMFLGKLVAVLKNPVKSEEKNDFR